jgi:DNA topoisomerase I
VTAVDEKPGIERPAPPFTTSTLTQEASRKLGFSTARTMQIAQRLFQGIEVGNGEMEGLITYHRTDSTTLSEKALTESARVIRDMFGAEYYNGPRRYQTKVKNAQEAHEAIRPTDFRMAPARLASTLESDDLRLYDLIWKRTMASQIVDARVKKTTVEITASAGDGEQAILTATGKAIEFAGFRRAYVEGSDDPQAELEDQETILPACRVGDQVYAEGVMPAAREGLAYLGIEPKKHETVPPARYTEAALIKELEAAGIGRPSTYASIIATIQSRGYVFRQGKALVPSFTAFAVTELLRQHFTDYVDVGFTAEMEEVLDAISNGERDWLDFVRTFYRGNDKHVGLDKLIETKTNEIDYPVFDLGPDSGSGEPIKVRIGRYGPFLQRAEGGEGNTASLPEDLPPADLTVERALQLLNAKAQGPREIGVDKETGLTVYAMNGRFGPYVQLGETSDDRKAAKPKRASLFQGMSPETVTLDEAIKLLSLPREVGLHPADQQPIIASPGRYGPYIKHGNEFRSLDSEDQLFTITPDQAVELLAAPKQSRRKQSAAKSVLKSLGSHPKSGAPVNLLSGRYGPYVTDGTTNASLPRGADPEQLTMDGAVELLAAREGAPKKAKRPGRPAGGARKGARKRTPVGAS